MALPPPKWSW